MSSFKTTRDGLAIPGADRFPHGSTLAVPGGVEIVVTRAFGPAGDNLVGLSDVTFDGHPAVTLRLQITADDGATREGLVHLSPIHGDTRKAGFTDIPAGTRCTLLCPVSGRPLPVVESTPEADYCALYLTPRLEGGSQVLLSNVWGHYHSRITDEFELVSAWAFDEQPSP